jgi:putative membrane protein
MVKSHENSIDLFEKALNDAKDADVRAFADKTLPALRMHLDSARALSKKY